MKIITYANLVTFARIIIVGPLAIYSAINKNSILFLLFMLLFYALDLVDGYLARKFDQASALGASLDGIADVFGLIIIAGYFLVNQTFNLIQVVILLIPKAISFIGAGIVQRKYKKYVSTHLSKWVVGGLLVFFMITFFIGFNKILFWITVVSLFVLVSTHFLIVLRYVLYNVSNKLIAFKT